jgi:hypothetical protein
MGATSDPQRFPVKGHTTKASHTRDGPEGPAAAQFEDFEVIILSILCSSRVPNEY